MFLRAILFLNILIHWCFAYKILIMFPVPGISHSILGNGYVNNLLKAGHEITYITPYPIKDAPPNLRQIDVSSNMEVFPDDISNLKKIINKELNLKDISTSLNIMLKVSNASVMHENVQKLIQDPREEFDVVIVEWLYVDVYSGLSSVFNCPLIWSSSMDAHPMVLSLIDEHPNPAYSPGHVYSSVIPPFTFWERAGQLWTALRVKYNKWLISCDENKIFNDAFASAVAKRGRTLPPFYEVKYNGSLMLGNSHVSSGQALHLPQNYVPIAGYHIEEEVGPLPQELQRIMDEAVNGVIYFSMGSLLRSESLPEEIKKGFLDVFSGLNQTVIWKFEGKLPVQYNNVHLVKWAPQQSILAHPRCLLFITHGGLLSITEAIHFSVPIIGIPIFADQFNNINKAVKKGFAKIIDLNFDSPRNLKEAIKDMYLDSKYRERVKELSFIYHNRPVSPRKELVHWVEHVIRTGGALHLRSPALMVPWYQKIYLDHLFVILIVIFAFIWFLKRVLIISMKRNQDLDVTKKFV